MRGPGRDHTVRAISVAAPPDATLEAVLVVFGLAAVIILSSLALLDTLDSRNNLPEEGADSSAA